MNCDSINITLIDEKYICSFCGCSNGFKFVDNIKVKILQEIVL